MLYASGQIRFLWKRIHETTRLTFNEINASLLDVSQTPEFTKNHLGYHYRAWEIICIKFFQKVLKPAVSIGRVFR